MNGDIADAIINDGIDSMIEDGDNPMVFFAPKMIRCKYCKTKAFFWKNFGTEEDQMWRLATKTGKMHQCQSIRNFKVFYHE